MDYNVFFMNELKDLCIDDKKYEFKLQILPRSVITETLIDSFVKGEGVYSGVPQFDGYYDPNTQTIYISKECTNKENTITHEIRHAYQNVQIIKYIKGMDLDEGVTKEIVIGWIEDNQNTELSYNLKRHEIDAYTYADNKYPRY